jgi:acetyl/propionyl-CoA carboxylase alpha subunit
VVAADRLGAVVIEITRAAAPGELIARDGDRPLRVDRVFAVGAPDKTWVFHDGIVYEIAVERDGVRRSAHAQGALTAPMPATIIEIKVAAGDAVKKGDILIVLEAMKMELPVRAPGDGRVKAVHCRPGDLVQPETSLIDLE